jgi:uncharacterized protein with beta-barrel porin domain
VQERPPGSWRFSPAHDFNTDRSILATFQTLAGASIVTDGAKPANDAALTTASVEIKWLNGISLAAASGGEFSGITRSYAGKDVARYSWWRVGIGGSGEPHELGTI